MLQDSKSEVWIPGVGFGAQASASTALLLNPLAKQSYRSEA